VESVRPFLRLCLRARRQPAARAAMRAEAARLRPDWDEIGRVAEQERIAPLLHRIWREEAFVPAEVQRRLRQAYLASAHRNLVLLYELRQVIAALGAAGVRTIVLKGAALAESLYGNAAVRPLMDVDLLLERERLDTAVAVLAAHGFAPERPETRTGAAAAYENELLLWKSGRVRVPLELHWSLFDSPYYQQRIDLGFCWEAAAPLRLGAVEARMLDPLSQLLHLCGHLVLHHGGEGLLWEEDVAALVQLHGARLDWPLLLARAEAFDLVIPVRRVLLGLAPDDAAAIPAPAYERLRQLRPTPAEERIVSYLTAEERGVAQRFWTDLASIGSWRSRLGYACTHLFPSSAYMRRRYRIPHPLLLPLYYPYRWLRGLLG
jgi:hypothetical protein